MDPDITMPPTLPPGGLGWIDDYVLVRELGSGGFGSVYLVRDPKTLVEYAVKGLPPIVRQNREELENILANFRLVQTLAHAHIASMRCVIYPKKVVYFHPEDQEKLRVQAGDPLIVMSYAPGMTLSKWRTLQPGGRVAPDKAAQIVWQIADALDYAHTAQPPIIHRDVKPSNVMIEERADGTLDCQVLDFGLAAEIRTTMGRVSMEIRDVCGTRPYMAPEQWTGDRQGPGTDQYALAVLYHELVTGTVPLQSVFDTGDVEVMRSAVLSRRPDLADVPRAARKAVARALAKKASRRYPTCRDFAAALTSGSVFPKLLAAIGMVALTGAAAALVVWMRGSGPRSEGGRANGTAAVAAVVPTQTPASRADRPEASAPAPARTAEPPSPSPVPAPAQAAEVPELKPVPVTTNAAERIASAGGQTKVAPPPTPPVPAKQQHVHRFGEPQTIRPATCREKGFEVQNCLACSAVRTNALPERGHSPGSWETNRLPNCTESGERSVSCKRCKEKLDSQLLAPHGHAWNPWRETRKPEPGVAGEQQRQCSRCDKVEREIIAPRPLPVPALVVPPVSNAPRVDIEELLRRAHDNAESGNNKEKYNRNERLKFWATCRDIADEVLKLDSANQDAKTLKHRAETRLETLGTHQDAATPFNTGVENPNGFVF